MSARTRDLLLNGVLFQVVWFACVAGAGLGNAWLGPLCLLAFATWHLPRSAHPRREAALATAAAGAGFLFESGLLQLGVVRYAAAATLSWPPLWILSLWAGFAFTLNSSLRWAGRRVWIAAVLGGVAGPLSFWSGAAVWGAVDFLRPTALVLGLYGAAWAVILPALYWASQQLSTRPRAGPNRRRALINARVATPSSGHDAPAGSTRVPTPCR